MSEEPAQTDAIDESRLRQRRWLRILLLASLVILLVVVGSEFPESKEPSQRARTQTVVGPNDQFIAPGDRVGFLRLGLHISLVEERLGRGLAKPTQSAVLYRFDQAGLTCAVQHGQVSSILISSPIFKTPTGLCVGSDADTVVRELGDEYEFESQEKAPPTPGGPKPNAYTLHYWREGVHVNLVQDKVESILVTAPTAT